MHGSSDGWYFEGYNSSAVSKTFLEADANNLTFHLDPDSEGITFTNNAESIFTNDLSLTNDANITLGTGSSAGGDIVMYASASGNSVSLSSGLTYASASEYGLITQRLLLTSGRFDFDASGGKSEIRLDGASTIFNIFNKSSSANLFSANGTGVLLGGNGSQTADQKLTVIGNFNVKDANTATKQYRFRTNGGSLDFEGAGSNIVFSVWSSADFTGTQRNYYHARSDANTIEAFNTWEWKPGLFNSPRHIISGGTATVTFNEQGEDIDHRIEGDTDANLLFVDASADTVQIGATTTADSAKFYVSGKISTSGELEINGALNHDGTTLGFYGVTPATRQVVPTGSSTDTVITALQNIGLFSQS